MFQTYGKAIVAAVYAVAIVAVPLFTGDNHVDPSEGVAIAIAVCTAALTYLVPMVPGARWAKTAVGAVLAGLQVLTTVIVDGVDANDMLLIALAILSFLGIAVAPAVSTVNGTGSRASLGA